ncbi:unnamed protein product [Urochloa humidicola]
MDSASCEQSFELRAVEILRVSAAASLSSKGESTLSTKAPHIGKKAMPAGSSSFIDPKHAGRLFIRGRLIFVEMAKGDKRVGCPLSLKIGHSLHSQF